MSKPACPGCHQELDDEAAPFCDNCGQPLQRCPHCNTLFRPGARFCKNCGKPIYGMPASLQSPPFMGIVPGYNLIEIDETAPGYEYHSKLVLTNEAIGDLRETIHPVVVSRTSMRHQEPSDNHQHEQGTVPELLSHEVPELPQLPAATSEATASLSTQIPEQAIWQIFRKLDDGKLRQNILKLKASSKKDYTIKLIYLYLYAKELLGEAKVPRTEIYQVLDDVAVRDGNTAAYISQDDGIRSVDDAKNLQLITKGRIQTQQFILHIFKDGLTDDWYPGIEESPNKPQRNSDKQRKNSDEAVIERWASLPETKAIIDLNLYDAISTWPVLDQSLLALYVLSKAGVEQGVVASMIAGFLHKAFSIQTKENSIGPTLSRAAKNKPPSVMNAPNGQGYQITPTGCTYVQNKLKGGTK